MYPIIRTNASQPDTCASEQFLSGEFARLNALDPLRLELDAWVANGEIADLWWRDDDADAPTEEVRRMVDLAGENEATVVIATVPAKAEDSLAPLLLSCPRAVVVQHGYAHQDHSPVEVKGKWELGLHRPKGVVLDELKQGWARLQGLFGDRVRTMLVPPWNRIDADVVRELPTLGFTTLSTFGPRSAAEAAPGLRCINCHCDIVAWKRGRVFIGAEKTAERLVEHLRARRLGELDPGEPTGLLTHVWINDEQAWSVLRELLRLVAHHPGGRWLDQAGLGL